MEIKSKACLVPGRQIKSRFFLYTVLCFTAILMVSSYQDAVAASETLENQFPGLSNGLLKSALLSDLPEGVILESGSVIVRDNDIISTLNQSDPRIRSQLERNLFFLLEQTATRMIIISEAQATGGKDQKENERELIGRHLAEIAEKAQVTDSELKAFYDGNQEMVGGASFDQVKEPIRQLLLQQKKEALIGEYIQNLGQNREVTLDRSWVEKQYALALDNPVDKARQSGKPTMVEFGATGCIPCDMMQPILESLRMKFGSKLNVVFVQVREQQILGARYGIRSIPVQVFFDAQGREVFRHEGFLPEEKILPILKDMGLG